MTSAKQVVGQLYGSRVCARQQEAESAALTAYRSGAEYIAL
jgi:hypothetical protein